MDKIDIWIICGVLLIMFALLALCDTYIECYKDEKKKREEAERKYKKVCAERDSLRDRLHHTNTTAKPKRPAEIIVIENLFGWRQKDER